jgi:hypothetical protein
MQFGTAIKNYSILCNLKEYEKLTVINQAQLQLHQSDDNDNERYKLIDPIKNTFIFLISNNWYNTYVLMDVLERLRTVLWITYPNFVELYNLIEELMLLNKRCNYTKETISNSIVLPSAVEIIPQELAKNESSSSSSSSSHKKTYLKCSCIKKNKK